MSDSNWIQTLQEPGWGLVLDRSDRLIIEAPNKSAACKLIDEAIAQLACSVARLNYKDVLVRFPGGDRPFRIPVAMASEFLQPVESLLSQLTNSASQQSQDPKNSDENPQARLIDQEPNALLAIPELELNYSALYNSERPTYISQLVDQVNVFANPAALAAQGKKPSEFLGQNAYALNEPEELEYRCDRISSNETLREYEYQAWRWYFDLNANRWRLKRMAFVSNFRLLRNYLGQPCWLGQVLNAEELQTRMA